MKLGLRLRLFDNRVLRKIFGSKMESVAGDWGKLCNEKLVTTRCYLDVQTEENDVAGTHGTHTEFWWWNLKGKDHLLRPRHIQGGQHSTGH